ncbi:MAG: SpoIID/LytB domain-containing protein [Candidatus Omnitrophica bacterium]|nr:SpoIID/LytB domain-containing protein [Candidatus Omnitrophota bacterium]
MIKKLLGLLVLSFVILLIADDVVTAKAKLIRVAILRDQDHFTVAVDGRYEILDFITGKVLQAGPRLRPVVVTLENGRTKVGTHVYDLARIIIAPRHETAVSVNDGYFRGNIVVINNSGAGFTVVNSIELELYIRGVLYHEISDKWPMEAIKAQAVATRTFALYSMEKFAARDYDVTNDIYSQVYGGKGSERYRTNVAVRRTRGEVLMYKGKIFPTFFHANSGGVTEDASELWDVDILPLKGGVISTFSVNSPHYQWRRNFRLKDIQDGLNARGYKLGLIKDIQVIERNKSGRVRKLKIVTRDDKAETIEGKLFRDAVGPNLLRSNLYEVEMKGWYVDFVGRGWGHGVGMCQWGAYNMAMLHHDYKQILSYYYPSSDFVRIKGVD